MIPKRKLSRKERKQKRRNKTKPPKETFNNDKIILPDEVNKLLWKWAKEVSRTRRFPLEWQQKKMFCPICKRCYCLGGDEVDTYCDVCWIQENKEKIEVSGGFFTGCTKELIGRRICQHCTSV